MLFNELLPIAEKVVSRTRRRLPAEIRPLADKLPVCIHDRPTADMLGGKFEPDILGLFIGDHFGIDTGAGNTVPPQIILFLGNIWDEAQGDPTWFKEEVRQTYLHELGHYLGWDEGEVEARGL